ncbi:MAG TPA: TetR/AcrR family transcriptional regulator [Thermoleophilaceae bacterium]|nr:TetR/AcrR family transcriptional regulator [Thermoleophilaceae bacterium]
MAEPSTDRGRETRDRIVIAAARLFHARGVNATTVDDVLAASASGKGQFYRYFQSREDLLAAVVRHQTEQYLAPQQTALERLESWDELGRYLADLVSDHRRRGLVGGCPVGGLALELADHDEGPRKQLADALDGWQASLAAGLERLAAHGLLEREAPVQRLAAATMAAIQGAYLLATVHRDGDVMARALEDALARLRSYEPGGRDAEDGTV